MEGWVDWGGINKQAEWTRKKSILELIEWIVNGAGLLLKERGVMAGGPLAQLDFSSINFVDFRSTIFAPFPFFAPAKRGQPLFYFIHSQTKGKKEISWLFEWDGPETYNPLLRN